MNSLKSLKMKKVEDILATEEDVEKAKRLLEEKTEEDFRGFARAKKNVREIAHKKRLD